MRSASYRPSKCCGGADCEAESDNPDEPCWGQVEMAVTDDIYNDEDGFPVAMHVCQGHIHVFDSNRSPGYTLYVHENHPEG